MKKTRILATFLAALTLLPVFASCANHESPDDPKDSQTTASAESEDETEIRDNLPADLNYGGDTIVFINDDTGMNLPDEVYVEGFNSDPVNDAIYERNRTVEARLNVKIDRVLAKNDWVVNQVITSVNSGSSDYDIMVERCWRGAPKTIEGYFANLRESEYLDFDQPWWTQDYNKVMSYKGMQFAVTGSMLLSSYRRTHTTVFNKKLFTDANQAYLYDYVENGTWTLDKQNSLAPLLSRDNGNGVQDENSDTFGFVTNTYTSADPYWSACDIDIVRTVGGDGYEWVFDPARMSDAMDKILQLFYSEKGTFCLTDDDSLQSKTSNIFADGRAAMATLCIIMLEDSKLRNMEDEYGVVPMPKFDEAQANYQSYMHDAYTIASIPTTVQGDELSKVSAVLEAMGSAGYNIVRPMYYETTLRTKIAQDPQSAAMMELIINGIQIDPGIVFSHNLGSFHQGIQDIVKSRNNSSTSYFKSKAAIAKKNLTLLTRKLDALAEQP